MILLVSGATVTVQRLAEQSAFARAHLGHLVVPRAGNRPEALAQTGLPVACDNGCFTGWDPPRFFRVVRKGRPLAPLWITVPDHFDRGKGVGYARSTLEVFYHYASLVGDAFEGDYAGGETPLALVAQDGVEDLDLDWALSYAACLFLGGSTEWKLSKAAEDLAEEAKRRGKWVHCGRCNTWGRFRHAFEIGCDSVDGSGFSKWPYKRIPKALRWLRRLEEQPLLLFREGKRCACGIMW
jgi:hypothetical protein